MAFYIPTIQGVVDGEVVELMSKTCIDAGHGRRKNKAFTKLNSYFVS